jgi:hypothetical protein
MAAGEWKWRMPCVSAGVGLLWLAMVAFGGEHSDKPAAGKSKPQAENVELFKAIAEGQISVRLIPKDSTECRVMIENKTKKPLTVKLPDSFAGVPVLAQGAIDGGRGNRNRGGTGGGGGNQGFGGGMGGRMGGGGMGMGMFSVPPEKVGQFKVPTVCLEHGKDEPRPSIPYEIKPIEEFTTKPGVRELCEMLGSGQLDQRAAQAAAWNLNNDMSWEELAAKRLHSINGPSRPYFTAAEIRAAMQLAAGAIRTAKLREQEQKQKQTSPGESASGQ